MYDNCNSACVYTPVLNHSKLALRHTDDLEKFMKPVLCFTWVVGVPRVKFSP